ncbi:MAG: hypothetical protein DRO23_09420 [Thermoprotei archaeon]|nr:MAG: hypothetical protein DRO23_09420 [Thermoprotei archaeon]
MDEYAFHQYKDTGSGIIVDIEWEGKTSLSPAVRPIIIQAYNRNTTTWDTLVSFSTAVVGSDINITKSGISTTNYADGSGEISFRVYQ